MVTKKRTLQHEFEKILEPYGVAHPTLIGQLVGVVEAVYAKKPKDAAKKLDARAYPFTVSFQTHVGYPLANFAKELHFADWLFKHGYTAEQALACYDDMKRGWWKDKSVGLAQVADHIGEFVNRNHPVATQVSDEDAQMKQEIEATNRMIGSRRGEVK